MDRQIERKGLKKKYIWIGTGVLLLLILVVNALISRRVTKLNVDKEKVTIQPVVFDKYQDYISVNGTVEPLTTIFLDAVESGKVEEILIEEGAAVRTGDVILRLSNYNLLLEISSNEANVSRAINDLKTARITLENQNIQTKATMLNLEYDLRRLERELVRNEELYAGQHISREDYELSREQYNETKLLLDLQRQKYQSDSVYIMTRIGADELSIERMQNNLELTRRRLENLEIKATVDGELATLVPEIGQVISYGMRIGTINVLDSYKMRVLIDEHYITRISRDLPGEFTFAGSSHQLLINKIYPEVRNGTFTVDMEFTSDIPEQIRIGQTARIRLELGESEDALLLPRGGFYQSTGGQWVYVVDPSGSSAYKRSIRLGRQNPNYYEVLDGLSAGEQVVVSGYENFGDVDKLIFK